MLIGFSESSEGVRRMAPQTFIVLISMGMFTGATPSPAFWDAKFAVHQAGEQELAWLADDVLRSFAYQNRFD